MALTSSCRLCRPCHFAVHEAVEDVTLRKTRVTVRVHELVIGLLRHAVKFIGAPVPESDMQRQGFVVPVGDGARHGLLKALQILLMRFRMDAFQEFVGIDQMLAEFLRLMALLLVVRETVRMMGLHQALVQRVQLLQCGGAGGGQGGQGGGYGRGNEGGSGPGAPRARWGDRREPSDGRSGGGTGGGSGYGGGNSGGGYGDRGGAGGGGFSGDRRPAPAGGGFSARGGSGNRDGVTGKPSGFTRSGTGGGAPAPRTRRRMG